MGARFHVIATNGLKPRWIIADRESGDFAISREEKFARRVCAALNAGAAQFCHDCGWWIFIPRDYEQLKSNAHMHHTCSVEALRKEVDDGKRTH
jgi:hypothetical protein